jgi:hypothetical protein
MVGDAHQDRVAGLRVLDRDAVVAHHLFEDGRIAERHARHLGGHALAHRGEELLVAGLDLRGEDRQHALGRGGLEPHVRRLLPRVAAHEDGLRRHGIA